VSALYVLAEPIEIGKSTPDSLAAARPTFAALLKRSLGK
jgi:hypothetical protein